MSNIIALPLYIVRDETAKDFQSGDKGDEQYKQLRKDLDGVCEENRSLREQLAAREARLT
jgi:hypothetical protein